MNTNSRDHTTIKSGEGGFLSQDEGYNSDRKQ